MKELKETVDILKDRISKITDEEAKSHIIGDMLFLIDKQQEYIQQLEELLESAFDAVKTL